MPFVFKRLALLLSITAAFAADKDAFHAPPASDLPHHDAHEQVTVAADPFVKADKAKLAFGKLNPYELGVLPVLVVIENDSAKTIRLQDIKVEYNGPNGDHVEATPAKDVKYLNAPRRPNIISGPPGQIKGIKTKNPLDVWEIEGRAFVAAMLPPGQTASGFFYFQTGMQRGATLYLTGLSEAGTEKQLLYFEVPLE